MEQEKAMKDLETIKRFLEEGKNQLSDNGFYFIYWGIAIPVVTTTFLILANTIEPGRWMNWFWPVAVLLLLPVNILYGRNHSKQERNKSFLSQLNGSFWSGMLLMNLIAMAVFYIAIRGFTPALISIIAMNLGLAYWVHGSMLKLNWIRFQGLIWWGAALVIAFMDWQAASIIMAATTFICSFGSGLLLQRQGSKV